MSRYIIKYKKEGYLKYTSHLDIMRFFQRTFKRAEIKLAYSHGFNPHPKMSIAQPLSLGYTSTGDYIEIETEIAYEPEAMKTTLSELVPPGIEIDRVKLIGQGKKTLAALVTFGEYEVLLKQDNEDFDNKLKQFLELDCIDVVKQQRKTGTETRIDIKPMIYALTWQAHSNGILLNMIIQNGSHAHLNPELLIQALMKFSNFNTDGAYAEINRKELYFMGDGGLCKLEDYNC